LPSWRLAELQSVSYSSLTVKHPALAGQRSTCHGATPPLLGCLSPRPPAATGGPRTSAGPDPADLANEGKLDFSTFCKDQSMGVGQASAKQCNQAPPASGGSSSRGYLIPRLNRGRDRALARDKGAGAAFVDLPKRAVDVGWQPEAVGGIVSASALIGCEVSAHGSACCSGSRLVRDLGGRLSVSSPYRMRPTICSSSSRSRAAPGRRRSKVGA